METSEKDLKLEFYAVTTTTKGEKTSDEKTMTKYHKSSDKSTAKADFETEFNEVYTNAWEANGQYTQTKSKYEILSVDPVKDGDGNRIQEVDPSSSDTTTKLYKYTVKYKKKYTDTSSEESLSFTADKDVSASVTIKDTTTTVRLDYITFNRQLYKPNEIVADLVFGAPLTSDDLKTLMGMKIRLVRYTRNTSAYQGKDVELPVEETFYGFYIYNLQPLKTAGQDYFVRLHIYSLDHQLTRKQYSRTYVGQRLMADILLSGCDPANDWSKGVFKYNTVPVALPFPFITFFNGNGVNKALVDLDHLMVSVKIGSDSTESDIECIQPYLVQYNESFYEFLARTANRCGEFFFWDDGMLRFGRTCDGSNTLEPNADGSKKDLATSIADSDCLSVYYTSVNGADTFANKYDTIDDQNLDLTKTPDHNYSTADSLYDESTHKSDYVYDDEVNHDVYRTTLYKSKFSSYVDEMHNNGWKYGVKLLSMLLNSQTLYDAIQNMVSTQVMGAIVAARQAGKTNEFCNEYHITDDERPNLGLRKDKDDKQRSLFTTISTTGHVDSTFYHTIRQQEDSLSKQLITFNLKNAKWLRLGQKITYNTVEYYVVQIKEKPATNAATGSRFAAVDAASEVAFNDMGTAVMQVVAIPIGGDSNVYPPMRPEGHIRRAEPQKAIVADYLDPQKRGRVRIKYPWHNTDDAEASPWIPVLTPSSTPGGGCSFELEVGDEVLVDYESGNIERPYVSGTLFNRKNGAPFRRGDMTLISKNGHGISFDDPIDSTKFMTSLIPAYGFLNAMLPELSVGGLSELRLTGGTTITDAYGFYKIEMSTDQRKIDISSPLGQINIDAFTGISINAPNGDINIKGQNVNIEAGNTLTITSGKNIKDKQDWLDLGGKSFPEAFFGSIGLGLLDMIRPLVNVVDLDFIRKLLQVFLRPIDGTLEIKSHKYLLLEAGKGAAEVERDRYKTPDKSLYGMAIESSVLPGLVNVFYTIGKRVDDVMDQLDAYQTAVTHAITDFDDAKTRANGHTKAQCPVGKDLVAELHTNGVYHDPAAKFDKLKFADAQEQDHDTITGMVTEAEKLRKAVEDYMKYYAAHCTSSTAQTPTASAFDLDKDDIVPKKAERFANKTRFNDILKTVIHASEAVKDIPFNDFQGADKDYKNAATRKTMKRKWFTKVFDEIVASGPTGWPYDPTKNLNHGTWGADVDALTLNVGSFRKALNDLGKDWDALIKTFYDRDHWESNKEGQLIISDDAAYSVKFVLDTTQNPSTPRWTKYDNKNNNGNDYGLTTLKQVLHQWD